MIIPLKKEVCCCCFKYINIGQSVTECSDCNCVIHTKCFKSSKFAIINDSCYCQNCKAIIAIRYNPYNCVIESIINDDESYDLTDFNIKSTILENCTSYTVNDFNKIEDTNFKNNLSTFFLNIDGNQSNFDSLTVELHRYKHKFSIIGIAETNCDSSQSNVYHMPNYNSFYQDTQPGKKKGSGVALYIHK